MKFIKDNIVFIVIILILLGSGGFGFNHFKDQNKELQKEIESNLKQIDSLEAQKQLYIKNISTYQLKVDSLLEGLKLSQAAQKDIKRYYEKKYNIISNSTDSEYLEYLRSRISHTN